MVHRLLAITLMFGLTACGDETLDLATGTRDGGSGGEGGAGGMDAGGAGDRDGGGMAGAGGAPDPMLTDGGLPVLEPDGGGEPIVPMPDRVAFESVIMPIIDARCSGGACHAREVRDDTAYQYNGTPNARLDQLSPEQREQNFREFVAFVDWLEPSRSDIIAYPASTTEGMPSHPGASPVMAIGTPDYDTIVEWIADATRPPPEPDMGPDMGGADAGAPEGDGGAEPGPMVPCDALPEGDVLGRPGYFEAFAANINPMLVGQCRGGGCHELAGEGYGFYLRGLGECDTRWNFLTVQWFIDPRAPRESPVLVKPRQPMHGGREVFAGTDDPDYVLLQDWILSGL